MPSLHLEYVKEGEKTATSNDRIIREYIESNSLEYYDEVISSDHHYPVFYHLSMLRTGLLSWYDFRPQADVLEIGAGFGALTGLLCDKCSHVTVTEGSSYRAKALALRWQKKENLDIYAGEWSKISFGKQFDYIILNGILERTCAGSKERSGYADYLQKIANLLKPDGILLFSVENRMGLKYFCGAAEPHTNRAFDGINGYPKGTGGYSFSRQELKNIIKEAGFSAHKFYYPLPDYKLPQLIYTDEYLPQQNVRERLIPYYYPEKNMIAVERELYRDVVENQVFPFFANSFLVECGNREAFGDVIYAAVSTDRGPDRSYATTIHKDKTVKKLPLCKEGLKNAESLYGNIVDLREHDIPVVGTLWEDGRLSMPFIPFPTLSDYMKEIMPVNLTHFQELLDRLYAYILQSSEEIQGVNGLSDRLCSRGESEEEKAKIKSLNWGPILKRAYMELIPLNCFYDKTNHQFLFFDQEFVREDYPAKYVLFRAIHYIYCFTPDAETYLPGKILREKYGLQETWEYYLKEEKAFLDEIRNHRMYRNFYRWTHVNKSEIYGNADKLMSEEEKIANYTVSDKMKKVWKVELDMLDRVDAICKKHHLQYFIVHGTLLGAVRHKGFIPWDDDLDIGMLRKDYDRFLEIAAMEFKDPYVIQNMWTEKDCFLGGYTRIRNSHTTGIQVREIGHRSNQGIWIDILPIDNCTMNEERFQKKGKQIKHAYRLLMAKVYGKETSPLYDLTPWKWRAYRLMAKGSSHASLCGKLDRAMRLYTNEETEDVAIFSSYEKYQVLRKADFESTVSLEFAGRRLPAPAGYENYLFITQGKDYMKYPPEIERRPKHRGIFDPERPYTEYLQKLTGMFDDIKGKQIILFGAGMMFDDYMQNWGGSYRPSFLVDNDRSKWGRSRKGIEIKSPGEILKIPVSKRRLIICSFYYKEIEKQLEEMGITDYQVYVQHAEWIVQAEEK